MLLWGIDPLRPKAMPFKGKDPQKRFGWIWGLQSYQSTLLVVFKQGNHRKLMVAWSTQILENNDMLEYSIQKGTRVRYYTRALEFLPCTQLDCCRPFQDRDSNFVKGRLATSSNRYVYFTISRIPTATKSKVWNNTMNPVPLILSSPQTVILQLDPFIFWGPNGGPTCVYFLGEGIT